MTQEVRMARRRNQARIAGKLISDSGAASLDVISSRLRALSDPQDFLSPRQQRELNRMVGEKLAAGVNGWMAAGIEMSLMPYRALRVLSRPPASIADGMAAWMDLWLGVGNAALGPARKTVVANRKRLRRAGQRRTPRKR